MHDIIVIGAGILGTATALRLKEALPGLDVVLLDKETDFACHQTGRNSGVIHAGVYYKPGSLKARFCKAGVEATIRFCEANEIAYEQCGKLLVATDASELGRMHALAARAVENGLDVEMLDADALREREPNIAGEGAIFVPSSGIVDYRAVTEAMAARFRDLGGLVVLESEVRGILENDVRMLVDIEDGSPVTARYMIACAGLQSDRLATMAGLDVDFRIVPFRGEYYRLRPEKSGIIRHLIYPIPDPALPFLGVHLTRMVDGSVTVGPNAVLGFKREGYGRLNADVVDLWDLAAWPGFWRLAARHWRTGVSEFRDSLWKKGYLERVRKYCPSLTAGDLLPHPAGIRAQAVAGDGSLVDDFLIKETPRSLHVCNAPSPAATSAIPIADHLCRLFKEKSGHA